MRALAGQLRARLPHECGIEMADLIQAGNVGLLQAARTYDSARKWHALAGYAEGSAYAAARCLTWYGVT